MVNHSQLQPDSRKQQVDYINQRWAQLYNLEKEWSDKAVNFLFLTNSGGAIAMLGFIGATGGKVHQLVVWGLCIMLFGLILLGCLIAVVYHQMSGLFEVWRMDVREFFADRISLEKLLEDDTARAKNSLINLIFAYSSFICFIIGIILGVVGLLK